jgi:tetratricopeptide (TPR) repeat protein
MAMNKNALPLALLCACAAQQPKHLVVPDGMRRQLQPLPRPENKPQTPSLQGAMQPATAPSKTGDGRYVLRLAEHNRVWELELPESAGGYEIRIPLDGPLDAPTAADSELLASRDADAALSRDNGRTKENGANAATKADAPAAGAAIPKADPAAIAPTAAKVEAASAVDATAKAPRKSYLGTLAKVREMYASRKYEMALVEIVDLEASYPNDERLQAMKGSLYLKLGKPQLARDCWQKALALDPDDAAVAEALRNLKED